MRLLRNVCFLNSQGSILSVRRPSSVDNLQGINQLIMIAGRDKRSFLSLPSITKYCFHRIFSPHHPSFSQDNCFSPLPLSQCDTQLEKRGKNQKVKNPGVPDANLEKEDLAADIYPNVRESSVKKLKI